MKKLLLSLLLAAGAVGAEGLPQVQTGAPDKLAFQPGQAWESAAKKAGAFNIECRPLEGYLFDADTICRFSVPEGHKMLGLPLHTEGSVILHKEHIVLSALGFVREADVRTDEVVKRLADVTGLRPLSEGGFTILTSADPNSTRKMAPEVLHKVPAFLVTTAVESRVEVYSGNFAAVLVIVEMNQR